MAGDLILPEERKPDPKKAYLAPVPKVFEGRARAILQNNALGLIKPKFFIIDQSRANDEDSVNQPGSGVYNYDKKNVFGLPLFDTVVLNQLSYVDFEGKTINIAEFTLDIALIEVNNPRHIITTPIAGRNGDVHEYMSDGDYNIKISGQLINNLANVPPENMVRALNAFCKSQVEIKVNSTFLSYLDIYSIIITNPRFSQRMGARNVIDYELDCLSETPFELKQDA